MSRLQSKLIPNGNIWDKSIEQKFEDTVPCRWTYSLEVQTVKFLFRYVFRLCPKLVLTPFEQAEFSIRAKG